MVEPLAGSAVPHPRLPNIIRNAIRPGLSMLHALGDIIAKRYRITAVLGQINTSNTYVAEDFVRNKLIAVKAISLRQMGDWKDFDLLERQAKVLAQIDHPAVPRYIDYFHLDTDRDRAFYLVQQLITGVSLADLVAQGWRTDEIGVRNIALQVLDLLKYLHQQTPPVIHRDIQPANLLRGTDGRISLVDFGSVKATASAAYTGSSTFVGVYGYVPPEQLYGKACFASDLYSLGASLLFVLTGKPPDEFLQDSLKINFRGHVQLSPNFEKWLGKMLEQSSKARFNSASEAIAALRQQKLPSPDLQSKPTTPPARKPQMRPQAASQLHRENLRKQQPIGSRVVVRRDDGSFIVEVPPASRDGQGGMFDFLGVWHRLEIDTQRFIISIDYLDSITSYEGKTKDIIKAECRLEAGYWGETTHSLLIWEGIRAHSFAPKLTSVEKEWLADEILDFLSFLETSRRLDKLIDES